MKSRSHRLPISEPHLDDWVDGSWTVDCICGVTFDDGEEMVNCDECGVWVHTRCSRYVKTEKSFACDKCKSKKNGIDIRNDSEETEVAEFLVELPTKTLSMDNPNRPPVSSHRPFRLWTNIPMEERVHVQGVPGGDPELFSAVKMSPIFGPELWKCTGYVPKKFNFRYSEFPITSDGEDIEEKEDEVCKRSGEHMNLDDNGAGVLCSLLKENGNNLPTPLVSDYIGVKSPVGSGCHEPIGQKNKLDGGKLDFPCTDDTVKNNIGLVQPMVFYSGKRRKEKLEMLKDQSTMEKVRTTEKDRDLKRHADHASKPASTFSSGANQLEFPQRRGCTAVNDNIHGGKDDNHDRLSDGVLGECATNLASNERGLQAILRKNVSSDEVLREGKRGDEVKNYHGGASLTEAVIWRTTDVKEEVPGHSPECGGDGKVTGSLGLSSHGMENMALYVSVADPDSKESQNVHDTNIDEANSRPTKKLKAEVADNQVGLGVQSLSAVEETMKSATSHQELSKSLLSEEGRPTEKLVTSSEATDLMVHVRSRSLNIVNSKPDTSDESLSSRHQSKQEPRGSEASNGTRKRASGIKHGSEVSEDAVKFSGNASCPSTVSYQRKVVLSLGKFQPASANVILKSSETGTVVPAQISTVGSRRKEVSQSNVGVAKETPSSEMARDAEKCVRPKKLLKESSRLHSLSKVPHPTKSPHASDSDCKDSLVHSPRNVPSVTKVAATPVSGESSSPPQMEDALLNNVIGPAVHGKGENVHQTASQPVSKGSAAPVTGSTPLNVPATLSDEELALLLHQELNSSPRVPRVPRMRHAGSLPQLTCPTSTSTLMKRTSSAKDYVTAPKRKTKDLSRDGSHSSLEVDNEAKKIDSKPSSPDNRRRDQLSRREPEGSLLKGVHSNKTTNVSSSLYSSTDVNGHNISSSRPVSRIASDDNPRMMGRQTNRTLPGLIADIMREGKRMTYEELCDAVLPHWPHLRKHNGERYAYSSHSQAVLDCLRNRSEWARLVDRGPKGKKNFQTSASRKRRKLDTDSMSIESDDNDDRGGKHVKDVGSKSFESPQEDFPKGKRKARKRRRLALHGRGIVRRRRRADVVSDDESESFSNSDDGGMSSEDEIQGVGTSLVGNEASGSSEEGS